jgi:class 3 adenylate cyclase
MSDEAEVLRRRLETLERLDALFDRERNSSLEAVVPSMFAALEQLVPGSHWFLSVMLPDYEDGGEDALLPYRRQVFCSSRGASEAVAAVLATERFEMPERLTMAGMERLGGHRAAGAGTGIGTYLGRSESLGNARCVGLMQAGTFLGVLGAVSGSTVDPLLALILETAAGRIDTEVDLQVQRVRRRILARKMNQALEDYYLERGIERAMNILLANRICTGIHLLYDRSGVEGQQDLVTEHFTPEGPRRLSIPMAQVQAFLLDHSAVPEAIAEHLAKAGQGVTLSLVKRDEDGKRRAFGVIVFLGPSFSYSLRLMLGELIDDIDSAMINYHEKRRELSRFLSPSVVQRLLEGDRSEIEAQMAPRQQSIALGFADVVGYSRICSRYHDLPQQIAELLKDWKRRMREVTFRNGGIVDKFIGDCLFFHRGPWSSDSQEKLALDAVRIAVECAAETELLSRRLGDYGFAAEESLRVSIGLHLGKDLVVGDIGGEFTALGADVNIAQRIQAHESSSGRIVVSGAVRRLIGGSLQEAALPGQTLAFGPAQSIELKGVGKFEVFEVLAG